MHTMLHIPVHCLSPFDWYMMRFALRVSELCMSIGFCFFPFALFEFYWFWFELNVIKWCIFALLWVYVDGNVKKNASTKYGCAIEICLLCSCDLRFGDTYNKRTHRKHIKMEQKQCNNVFAFEVFAISIFTNTFKFRKRFYFCRDFIE